MTFLWKTLIILAIVLSLVYAAWDFYVAVNYSTVELEKYVVTKIQPNFLVQVFDHLVEKEPNINTKSEEIGANN